MMDNNNKSPQDIDPGLLDKINLLEQFNHSYNS